MPSSGRKAFTLVELLVVVVIIGILTGLLLPVLDRARAEARKNACANNLSAIGKACMMYTDSQCGFGRLPDASTSLNALNLLYDSYIKDARIFSCPGNPTVSVLVGTAGLAKCSDDVSKANLTSVMTNYGFQKGQLPTHCVGGLAADFGSGPPGENSMNHGTSGGAWFGQNLLKVGGNVDFLHIRTRTVSAGIDDIFSDDWVVGHDDAWIKND